MYPWTRQSRISREKVHISLHGIRYCNTKRQNGTRTQSSASGHIGARSASRRTAIGTRAICIWKGSRSTSITWIITGPQSRFGYKDLCAQWTLLNWEPDELIARYKKAGARIFVALANHHDGFDAWDSKHQPWNAAPWPASRRHRYMGGCGSQTRTAIRRYGASGAQLVVVSALSRRSKSGPLAGVPYDGNLTQADGKDQWWQGLDPQRLYGVKHPFDALPDISYVKNFYDRTRDLIDQHDPDLLYFDNSLLPLGWGGMNIGAYFYNNNLKTHGGKMEAVLNIKEVPDHLAKAWSPITSAA